MTQLAASQVHYPFLCSFYISLFFITQNKNMGLCLLGTFWFKLLTFVLLMFLVSGFAFRLLLLFLLEVICPLGDLCLWFFLIFSIFLWLIQCLKMLTLLNPKINGLSVFVSSDLFVWYIYIYIYIFCFVMDHIN